MDDFHVERKEQSPSGRVSGKSERPPREAHTHTHPLSSPLPFHSPFFLLLVLGLQVHQEPHPAAPPGEGGASDVSDVELVLSVYGGWVGGWVGEWKGSQAAPAPSKEEAAGASSSSSFFLLPPTYRSKMESPSFFPGRGWR